MAGKLKIPKVCPRCKKECSWFCGDICQNCYRKYNWDRKKIKCRRCERILPMKAKGLCGGCYNTTFMLDYTKAYNHRRNHGISMETYQRLTPSCVICSFSKVVDLHHLDENHDNNSEENLIGLCPNHHQMLHNLKYRRQMHNVLRKLGFTVPEDKKLNFKIEVEYD
jgi:hypothetical protein